MTVLSLSPLSDPLFQPSEAGEFMDALMKGKLSSVGRPSDEEVRTACLALDALVFRATVALGLWALPVIPERSGIGGMERLIPAAHPFRIEGHLQELTRQGRMALTGPADAWRRHFQQVAGNCFTERTAPPAANPSLDLFRCVIAPSSAGATGVRALVSAQATRLGRMLAQATMVAARLRALQPELRHREDGYSSRQLAARDVVLDAFRAHVEDRPLELPPLQEADVLYLASSPEPELRLLGLLLSERLGVKSGEVGRDVEKLEVRAEAQGREERETQTPATVATPATARTRSGRGAGRAR